MSYAAKYCAKDSSFEMVGRHWGIFNRKKLPMGEMVEIPITPRDAAQLKRWIHRSIKEVTRYEKMVVGQVLRFRHGFPSVEDEIALCSWKERRPNWKRLKGMSTLYGDPAQWLRLAQCCLPSVTPGAIAP